jgi:threonine/homoserine/homoserine lactone efflux protein
MFDSSFRAFAIMAAALVISPGASMAVITEMALQRGRAAALMTVAGVNIANSSLALASMLGLSAAFHQWPALFRAVSIGGAIYLTYLGIRALTQGVRLKGMGGQARPGPVLGDRSSAIMRGVLTNLLNPSVVLFYMLLLPQFISSADPFFHRFLLLAATHVSMSILWLSVYAMAVGTLGDRMARPRVRRILEILTGVVLVFLGVKLVVN